MLPVLTLAVGLLVLLPSLGAAQWLELGVPERPRADAASVEAGQGIYQERCWFCHGDEGDGQGPIAEYLWPRPRDFILGSYKLRTTESGELPTDEDLFRTISLGIPATAMPEWQSVLSVQERWQVISYIKNFAEDLFEDEAFDPYQSVIELGTPPPDPVDSLIAKGQRVFDDADCWECHGAWGRGDGEKAAELADDWDFPVWPADLHLGWKLKGGSTQRDIYLRLSAGLDGTPMPSYSETLPSEERGQRAYYVASLQEGSARMRSTEVVITARRIEGDLPSSPDDPMWESATAVAIPLTGQATFAPRWQIPAVTDLAVRAVYNADEIALWLSWDDRFADTLAAGAARLSAEGWDADDTYPVLYPDGRRVRGAYPDAVEMQFPVRYEGSLELPHFVYGNSGRPVDLWRWRADLQYSPENPAAVVELRARGAQQPPEVHSPESQRTTGQGVWQEGRWTVVVRRPLATQDGDQEVQLRPGTYVPVAFHVWEGANGETGLRMALSSWYFLYLRAPVPATSYLLVLLVVVGSVAFEYGAVRWTGNLAARGRLVGHGVGPAASEGE